MTLTKEDIEAFIEMFTANPVKPNVLSKMVGIVTEYDPGLDESPLVEVLVENITPLESGLLIGEKDDPDSDGEIKIYITLIPYSKIVSISNNY